MPNSEGAQKVGCAKARFRSLDSTHLVRVDGELVHRVDNDQLRPGVRVDQVGAVALAQRVQHRRLVEEAQRRHVLDPVKLRRVRLVKRSKVVLKLSHEPLASVPFLLWGLLQICQDTNRNSVHVTIDDFFASRCHSPSRRPPRPPPSPARCTRASPSPSPRAASRRRCRSAAAGARS